MGGSARSQLAVAFAVIVLAITSATGRSAPDLAATPTTQRVQATPRPVPTTKPTPEPAKPAESEASLVRFETCPDVLSHLRAEARKHVKPYGLPGAGASRGVMVADTVAVTGSSAGASGGGAAGASTASSPAQAAAPAAPEFRPPSFSRTNTQEETVDEPDIVKTDGSHIFTLRPNPDDPSRQRLTSIAVGDGGPSLVGGVLLPEGDGYELLLADGRVLAIAQDGYGHRGGRTLVAVVDVSDPADMRITDVVRLEGSYASARMTGGIVRLVLNTATGPEFPEPKEWSKTGLKAAKQRNISVIERTTIDDWFPRYKVEDANRNKRSEGALCACSSMYRTKLFSGFGTTTVVTIDPASPVPQNSASVLGASETVYASPTNLYVSTGLPGKSITTLHRFDTSEREARYAASGRVLGGVLNQWSLDEHEGTLRVATTQFSPKRVSSSAVTVLDATGSSLTEVGRVDGLGKNERIYGVRFIGDTGYVVTFRQIDPLHVVDLSDPKKPRVTGELKIPGYSAYLHPTDDGRLLGVGADIDPERGFPIGAQVSLFDVSDPAAPSRIDKQTYDQTWSPVIEDHHAFLYWAPERLAFVPVQGYGERPNGVIAMRVGRDGFEEAGRVSHRTHAPETSDALGVLRSIVIGDELYTLSPLGIAATDLASFTERGWVALR